MTFEWDYRSISVHSWWQTYASIVSFVHGDWAFYNKWYRLSQDPWKSFPGSQPKNSRKFTPAAVNLPAFEVGKRRPKLRSTNPTVFGRPQINSRSAGGSPAAKFPSLSGLAARTGSQTDALAEAHPADGGNNFDFEIEPPPLLFRAHQ